MIVLSVVIEWIQLISLFALPQEDTSIFLIFGDLNFMACGKRLFLEEHFCDVLGSHLARPFIDVENLRIVCDHLKTKRGFSR